MVRIARDPELFSYLSETKAEVDIVLGDGRLSLERSSARYDTLVLDAFSSDSIPVHLLTREAFHGYFDHLAPGGVIAVHISNRYFDLEPVLGRLSSDLGMPGIVHRYAPSAAHATQGAASSLWVMVARDPSALAATAALPGWQALDGSGAGPAWTDSYSNILEALQLS